MQADLAGEMRRLAGVLRIPVDETVLPSLVEAAGFGRMKERVDDLAPEIDHLFWRDTTRFFNRGGSGQWQDLLTAEDMKTYEAVIDQAVSPDLAEWVHFGWRGAGA